MVVNGMIEHVHGAPVGAEGYVYYGCRCEQCKASYMALGDNPRQRRLNGPTPVHVHGTWNGYSNYGCRCDKCLGACREKYEYGIAWRKSNRGYLRDQKRKRRAEQKEQENE
jgi:hypothetical protein